jgi:prepilin-type N-terminal cleavage/methylation domain-containing protein
MKKRGFTLIELLVVIAIIAMLLAILMPALSKVKKIAQRVVCGTNLKGLGTAQTVYAHDYNDQYAVQGRGMAHTWNDRTIGWQNPTTNVTNTAGDISIGASLYLLVREADVSPKSFVCPASNQVEFSGRNSNNLDIVELFDFGSPQYQHGGTQPAEGSVRAVSYAYQMPYAAGQPNATSTGAKGRFAADGSRSASFAVMADTNPFFDEQLTNGTALITNWLDMVQLIATPSGTDWNALEKWQINRANSKPHDRESQNVLFADGHSSNESRGDIGVKNDYIYSRWSGTGSTEIERRKGQAPSTITTDCAPMGSEDSVLVNDARNMILQ